MSRENKKNTTNYLGSYLNTGTVVSCDPGTMNITVAPDGQQNFARLQGIPLAATFAHSLGFKETILPQVGSRVLCFGAFGGFCLIIGTAPPFELQNDPNTAAFTNRQAFGTGEPLIDKTHAAGYFDSTHKAGILNNQMPTDVVQGEKVITNEFGVLLGLFQLMAVLKGSELSQVQCHFLDDLVRVISHNFQHYHALGAHNIFHDGKGLHMEIGLTHDPKESFGIPQTGTSSGDPTITDTDKNGDFFDIADERLIAVERLKLFVGKLGDFINLLLVFPGSAQRVLNGKDIVEVDKGLLQVHAGLDGLLIVRSVKGIILEKTNWIRVPMRKCTPEDPNGDDGTSIDYKMRTAFGFDNTYTDSSAPFLYYLQLRDYLAQVEEDLNYSNFNAHSKDFFVNGDYTAEKPLQAITYVDPITGTSFQKKRSIVALMPNGGLSLSDAWGSAINMEGGNIYIQPAKDLYLQPMRNIIGKVGGNISLAAKNDIDLSSTEGGMRIKTDLAQYQYSARSGIILHADGGPIAEGVAPYDGGVGGLMPVDFVGGVAFVAPKASVASYGSQVYIDGADTALIHSKALILHADNAMEILSKTGIMATAQTVEITAGARNGVPGNSAIMLYSQGSATMIGMTSTIVGIKNQVHAIAKAGPFEAPVEGLLDPNGKNADFFTQMNRTIDTLNSITPQKYALSFNKDENFTNLKFRFLPSNMYGIDDSDIIPQTMVQLEEATFTGLHALDIWKENDVNGTYPYPGADRRYSFVTTAMKNIDKTTDNELVNKASGLVTQVPLKEPADLFTEYTVRL